MALTQIPIELSSTPSIVDGGNATAITINSSEEVTFAAKVTAVGTSVFTNLDISGDIDVDGTTNLDVVDIDGAVDMASTLTVGTRVGVGVAAHSSAALNITTTNQHMRLNNGSELGIIELDSAGKINIWAHGDGETINLKTGTGSGTDVLSVVGTKVGIGSAPTDGTLHVHTASAGTVAASTQADDLVVENSAEGGITIITPNDQSARIRFTSPATNNDVGGATIFYRQNINKMLVGTAVSGGVLALASGAGNETMILDAAGNAEMRGSANVRISLGTAGGSGANNSSNWIYGNGTNLRFNNAGGFYSWETTGTERMRIDSSGNVGIGSAPDAWSSGYVGLDIGSAGSFWSTKAGASLTAVSDNSFYNGSSYVAKNTGLGSMYFQNLGQHYWRSFASVSAGANQTPADYMQLSATGRLGVGIAPQSNIRLKVNSTNQMHAGYFLGNNSGYSTIIVDNAGSSGTRHFMQFHIGGSSKGSITSTGSVMVYGGQSDYRLKENVVELTSATTRLKRLNPKRFNFIGESETVDGFIAHEVDEVVPEAVTGVKDAVDDDGNIKAQEMDNSLLVPLLVATIKELEARLTALENN